MPESEKCSGTPSRSSNDTPVVENGRYGLGISVGDTLSACQSDPLRVIFEGRDAFTTSIDFVSNSSITRLRWLRRDLSLRK